MIENGLYHYKRTTINLIKKYFERLRDKSIDLKSKEVKERSFKLELEWIIPEMKMD